jgi:phosphoribosyl 1,2-cyclic phosphate phosphodiesterase
MIEKEGFNLLIDTGPDFRYQMLRANITHLDAILMTHFHNDHIAGLDDIRPFNFRQGRSLEVYADDLTKKVLRQKFDYVFDENPYPGAPQVDLYHHDFSSFSLGPFAITPFEVFHGRLPITAYRIDDLLYMTDVKTIPDNTYDLLQGADTLILNALRREEHHSHLNLTDAINESGKIKPKKTYFQHISHYLGLHEEVEKELPPDIHLAYDTLSFII